MNFVKIFIDFGLSAPSSDPLAGFGMGQVATMRAYRDRPNTLMELATITRSRDATDPRDKLYSLIAIASDSAILPYQPNYHVAASRLYQDFTVAWIAENEKHQCAISVRLYRRQFGETILGTKPRRLKAYN